MERDDVARSEAIYRPAALQESRARLGETPLSERNEMLQEFRRQVLRIYAEILRR